MIESIISGWWKVLLLLLGASIFLAGALLMLTRFLHRAKDMGIDEIQIGNTKVDFEDGKDE